MKGQRVIVWFRQDLRLHDNEALTHALRSGEEVYPVYVFDERVFKGLSKFGFRKTDKYRAQFIIESVADLRASLRKLGSDLIIRVGKPEDEIFKIAQELKSNWVFCNRERTQEEVEVQDALEKQLWSIGQEIIYSRGKMLYYTQDLPFPITHAPDIFSAFRKEVEKIVQVRDPLPSPREHFQPRSKQIDAGEMPVLKDFGLEPFEVDSKAAFHWKGGETEGLKRLKYYLWESDLVKKYFDTRNGMLDGDDSTKFSAWLSQGCLSPKMIYYELKRFESERGSNKSTYSIFFDLLWRDFFRLMAKKHGNNIFLEGGTNQEPNESLNIDLHILNLWIEGRTGVPMIDANMRELANTGFMSNRGRQNVASFLVKDLNINWQLGAEYFESLLIDYDPCSNWGNWNHIAGVGCGPRENRFLNILTQARKFDPNGDYVRHWLPELSEIPKEKIHQPDLLSDKEQLECHIKIGADYPKAMISTSKWEY